MLIFIRIEIFWNANGKSVVPLSFLLLCFPPVETHRHKYLLIVWWVLSNLFVKTRTLKLILEQAMFSWKRSQKPRRKKNSFRDLGLSRTKTPMKYNQGKSSFTQHNYPLGKYMSRGGYWSDSIQIRVGSCNAPPHRIRKHYCNVYTSSIISIYIHTKHQHIQ